MSSSRAESGALQAEMIISAGKRCGQVNDADAVEQQLMQRARDPLLVGEFLARHCSTQKAADYAPVMTVDATLLLAGGRQTGPELSRQRHLRYEERASLLEETIAPQRFEPSAADRQGALEHDLPDALTDRSMPKRRPMAIVLLSATCLFLALLLVSE